MAAGGGADGAPPAPLVFLNARTATSGFELFATDGTAAGTRLVKDLHTRQGSNAEILVATGSTFFFLVESGGVVGLWKSDGATVELIDADLHGHPSNVIAVGSRLYGTINEFDLWTSDGTGTGSGIVMSFPGVMPPVPSSRSGPPSSSPPTTGTA